MTLQVARRPLRIGLVTEPLVKQPLTQVMDWVLREAPEITDLEVGAGALCAARPLRRRMNVIAIEHEDPFVPPEVGIVEAARLLRAAMSSGEDQ